MDINAIYDSIEQKAAQNITADVGDYVVDGLLYCGKCNTPKQCRVELFGKVRTPFCICKCEKERREKEEEARKQRERERQIKEMRRVGFPESEMQKWTFARDDRANAKVSGVMLNYTENFAKFYEKGKGLLLYGNVGTGKTFAAACVANALIDRGYPCLMTNFARLTNTISGMFEGKQEYIDSLNRFSLLIIDDLASERDTEYVGEIVQNVIDARYRSGLPLIVTTNLTGEELKSPADMRKKRLYSRLLDMCIPLEVTGADRRRLKCKEDYDEYKNILGL